jgi:hypothetical protein
VRGAVAAARRARKTFSQGELAHERRPRADERRFIPLSPEFDGQVPGPAKPPGEDGSRTAKPCGPGARCWRQAGGGFANPTGFAKTFNPPATEARGIRLRGELGISRKTIAQGMPGCSGCTCMLVCALPCAHCTRDRGCLPAPGIPCALLTKGDTVDGKLRAQCAARSRSRVFAGWVERSETHRQHERRQ